MEYLPFSFIAGLLTVLSPCVFTLLPVILGTSLGKKDWKRPAIIITSLSVSIILFTFLLKASTVLIDIHPDTWSYISGGIIILFGFITLFPKYWEQLAVKLNLSGKSGELLQNADQKEGLAGDIMVGAALGPVFSSCSPTYALIIATILPQSFTVGLANLISYSLGLALLLMLIVILGQQVIKKLAWAANPDGLFKRGLGILLVVVGIAIMLGYDKDFEAYLLKQGIFNPTNIELDLLENTGDSTPTVEMDSGEEVSLNVPVPVKAPELRGLTNWINSDETTLEELKGKVVIVDFWTYSCINCIRTIPFLNEWHDKYADEGLVILGVHAPEFSFEKVPANVQDAVDKYEIEYPVVLDNDFNTWQAYNNRFWPAKYFIDRNGEIVHTHFGEGEYEESEAIIQYLLGLEVEEVTEETLPPISNRQTHETYLGYRRHKLFANLDELELDESNNYKFEELETEGFWSLDGEWLIDGEKVISQEDDAKLKLRFNGKDVYLVLGSDKPREVSITVDGELENLGPDVNEDGLVEVDGFNLIHLVSGDKFLFDSELEITFEEGVEANAFTFGS